MSGSINHSGTVADIPDDKLLERVVRGSVTNGRGVERWVRVMDKFALGRTYSRQLCVRFGLDPDEIVRRA